MKKKRVTFSLRDLIIATFPRKSSQAKSRQSLAKQSRYNREAAVAYAYRHWNNPNRAYPFFGDPGEGGDCTNFISQCLFAGGMPWVEGPLERFTWATYWWCKPGATDRDGDRRITLTWKVASAFHNHWSKRATDYSIHSPEEMIAQWPQWLEKLWRGDVIQLTLPEGRPYHTLLVVKKVEQDFHLAAHTYDTIDRSLYGTIQSFVGTGRKIMIYRI
ncbi:amidase domain-containing protein [Heliorestis convoluta]|uniref:Amidase domain-containing protein, putative n=1 Tax=Heliorestis convoluta TaxID=356322 RepID=A0A5Q2N2K5_9FIRM|nr:amidase domain-containing protein [Heliorestis convoluta]QGG48511.1 amidase domain-containing protein, putative [Heliorestis convoluta]